MLKSLKYNRILKSNYWFYCVNEPVTRLPTIEFVDFLSVFGNDYYNQPN